MEPRRTGADRAPGRPLVVCPAGAFPEELFRATTKAKLDYLALVTDTDLEDM